MKKGKPSTKSAETFSLKGLMTTKNAIALMAASSLTIFLVLGINSTGYQNDQMFAAANAATSQKPLPGYVCASGVDWFVHILKDGSKRFERRPICPEGPEHKTAAIAFSCIKDGKPNGNTQFAGGASREEFLDSSRDDRRCTKNAQNIVVKNPSWKCAVFVVPDFDSGQSCFASKVGLGETISSGIPKSASVPTLSPTGAGLKTSSGVFKTRVSELINGGFLNAFFQ